MTDDAVGAVSDESLFAANSKLEGVRAAEFPIAMDTNQGAEGVKDAALGHC